MLRLVDTGSGDNLKMCKENTDKETDGWTG